MGTAVPNAPGRGLVFNVMRFAVHDGPGIRTTVFLKGCPLHCWWCHNPESQSPRPEVVYSEQRCLRCGECVATCPNRALSLNQIVHRDPHLCRACGSCIDACLSGARQLAGEWMTTADLLAKVERDRAFYEESAGGVTLSGGEPLLQSAFAAEFLAACRAVGISTALDTCGYAPSAQFQRVAEHVDLFLFDLKVLDPARHRELTGVANDCILENLRWTAQQRKPVIVRVPVIPGCTDSAANLDAISALAGSLGLRRIDLLPYHRIARDKYQRLHREYRLADILPPSAERMRSLAAGFSDKGFSVRIGG